MFQKSKCTYRDGLEWYHFTGEPFQSLYDPHSCIYLCYAEYVQKICNCSVFVGWNMTKTDCVENLETRKCFDSSVVWKIPFVRTKIKNCLSNCQPKCRRKSLELKVFKSANALTLKDRRKLQFQIKNSLNFSFAAREVLSKLRDKAMEDTEKETILKNIARLNIYFPDNEQWKVSETIPKMTFSTFVSNVGGLVGMWLGISAVTVIEWMGRLFKVCVNSRKVDSPMEVIVEATKEDKW